MGPRLPHRHLWKPQARGPTGPELGPHASGRTLVLSSPRTTGSRWGRWKFCVRAPRPKGVEFCYGEALPPVHQLACCAAPGQNPFTSLAGLRPYELLWSFLYEWMFTPEIQKLLIWWKILSKMHVS